MRLDTPETTNNTAAERAASLAARWSLELDPPFPQTPGSLGNFVAPARRADGTPCVLKVSPYIWETRAEISALRLYAAQGAVALLDADPDLGALLLEHIQPGTMLASIEDDAAATRTAAAVLRTLWRSVPPTTGEHALVPLRTWCAAFERNRGALSTGLTAFPPGLFQRADALREELLSTTRDPVVLHGDLHHFNILRSGRAGWLAIDPKGLFGDRCFDVCQFLMNPTRVPLDVNRRRLDIFCAELGLDRTRARHWCLVHAVLNACWAFEDGQPIDEPVAYAQAMLDL